MLRRRYVLPAAILLWASSVFAAPAEDEKKKVEKLPQPQDLTFPTGDGVTLTATFYPSTKKKEAVPVVLLHMLKRSRNDYSGLAAELHKLGHAVLLPDLRGHGDSTSVRGARTPLDAGTMSRAEFANMVAYDMQVLRDFLVQRNNAGELNIEKLCVVGAEMGASVALTFTYQDWLRPVQGNKKQGQDVKALVLISPEWTTPGLPPNLPLTRLPLTSMASDPQLRVVFKDPDAVDFNLPVTLDFRREVSVYIVCGKGTPKAVANASRLHKMLKRFHPDPPARRADERDLFFGTLDTTLQGTKMLGVRGLNLEQRIAWFIELRLVKRSFPWAERYNPYEK